jgi:hypothetical protein
MRRIYKDVAGRAEKENWSYRDFLALLLAEEVARRKQTRLQRCTRSAHFPFFKTIDEFDFTLQSTLRQSVIGSYLSVDFVTEGRSLILHGKTGRGKTHLAVAIGYRAIQNGFETLFTTAAELIEDLSNASKKGHLQKSLATYTHPHVLLIDEVGYLTYPVFRNSRGFFPKSAGEFQITTLPSTQLARNRRVVPTYPVCMARQFWHGGEDNVSSRQSQKEGRQAATLFQRGGEPPRGAEPRGAADGVVSGGD